MAIDYKIVEKSSTISNLVFDKKDGRTRLIEIFRIDYGSAEGKKRHLLFEKIANPWFGSGESPRWSTSAYLQTSEIESLFQTATKQRQKTGTSMVASKDPVKLAKKSVAQTETIRNYVGDRVTSYFIPKAIKDEKLKKEIVKKLTNAGFKPVNHKLYGISFPSPSAWMQTLIMTDGIPEEALNMSDLSKVQFADDFNKGKTTSARQQLDKNKKQLQTQSENKKMKITKKELVSIIKEEVEKALEQKDDKVKMAIAYLKLYEEKKIKELKVMLMGIKTRPDSPEKTQKILDYSEKISDISNMYMQKIKEVLEGDEALINKIIDAIKSGPSGFVDLVRKRASQLKDLKQISFGIEEKSGDYRDLIPDFVPGKEKLPPPNKGEKGYYPKGMGTEFTDPDHDDREMRIPFSAEEMKTFFNPVGALTGDLTGGGGISALKKDSRFQDADQDHRLLTLKVAKKYISKLPDPDLKKSEIKKWRSLYRKNHPNRVGMARKRKAAAQKRIAVARRKKKLAAIRKRRAQKRKARMEKGLEAGKAKAAKSRETPTMKTITPPEVDSGPIV